MVCEIVVLYLILFLHDVILRFLGKRHKRFPASAVELAEEFNILQTIGMNISTQCIDRQIERMPYDHDQEKEDRTHDTVSLSDHLRHVVKHIGDDAGRQTQCQES